MKKRNLVKLSASSSRRQFSNIIKVGFTVLISVLIIFTVVKAGTITPPEGDLLAQFYTLSEIYTRLTTNATTTEGSHDFTFSDALAGTGRTLTEIYNAIPTIDPSKLLDDTTYLGITGNIATRTLSSTSTDVSAGYYAATTLDAVDADLISGNIKSGVTLFGIDGDGNVVDTSDGTVTNNNQIRSSYVCYSDGTQYTGSLPDCSSEGEQSCYAIGSYYAGTQQNLSDTTTTVSAGYYQATTLDTVDADLISDNIKSGVTLFGIDGDSNVVDTSDGTVTNNNQIRSSYVCYSDGTQYTGSLPDCSSEGEQSCYATGSYYAGTNVGQQTITPTTSNQTITQGYHNGTGYCEGDADLVTGNIRSGVNIFGVSGNPNVVNTSSGNASAGDICNSKKAWVDGSEITGNRTACQSCASGTAHSSMILDNKTADIDCDGTAEPGYAPGVLMFCGPLTTCGISCQNAGMTCVTGLDSCDNPTSFKSCDAGCAYNCCICN
jgi:hypothetical protein